MNLRNMLTKEATTFVLLLYTVFHLQESTLFCIIVLYSIYMKLRTGKAPLRC